MKSSLTLGRVALVAAAFALVGATASVAHDPNQDVARKQRELDELRTEKNRLQDQNLELARRFDAEKRRLLDEKDNLMRQSAREQRELILMQARLDVLERQQADDANGAPAPPARSPLDMKTQLDTQEINFAFDGTDLVEVVTFLQEITGLRYDLQGADGLTVTLRAPNLTLRTALDLLVRNARDGSGGWAGLGWSQGDDGVVSIRSR